MQGISACDMNRRRLVLIVDDEFVNRQLLGFIINRDYDVIYAENGREALEQIKRHEKMLSLVLLDLLMPEIDGYELLQIIKDDANLRRIPVIVLTSEKSAEVQSLQLGAADFITKPYDMPEVILARVRRSIELAENNVIIHATENDVLTGLYTRQFFFEYCQQHDRYCPEMPMDALVLNINHFRILNELHGRPYGDNVLRIIADSIITLLSGSNGIACRCDADTFYIYLSHHNNYDELLDEFMDGLKTVNLNNRISLRMGVYENVDKEMDIEQRFDRAILACNTLRGNYKTAYVLYDMQFHEREIYSEKLIEDMYIAIEQKQFKVYYQPKYDITGDTPHLYSAEALIRWIHPEYGMISPGSFIPLFEENGLIQKLDRYVWEETASQIARWKENYGVTIPVSVNVSRINIYDPNLENELIGIVENVGLTPKELHLEITESAYTNNSHQIVETVERLRSHGFHIEMDDFGSGYSSLNMLSEMPIDALKLDMKFVRNICTNEKDRRMVKLIIEIAEFLNVPVIAEGVETKEQCDLLKKMSCDVIQGYYFSRPVPPEEFNSFIEKELSS